MSMNIKAAIIPLQQGTEEWAQHRAKSLNASELAVAMGLSPNMQRNNLIRCKATGIPFEHSDFVEQRVFAPGHQAEAAARPLAEEIIGEDLYCSVFAAEVDGLYLSASLDGHTLLNEVTWEHKQANAALVESLSAGIIPEQYHPQMEQGLMLTGAARCLFTASNGTRESAVHVWYESRPELRAQIIPAWKQFMADVAAYVPTEPEAKPTGKAPETLPALRIEVTGMVAASNLAEFKETALTAIRGVNRSLSTDQDFADAEKSVKWCEEVESRLQAAKDHALSQTASIDELFRTIDDISEEARRVRLDLTKLVKARKDAIKAEIVAGGVSDLAKHIGELNAAMPANYMPNVPADFAGAIKGLKSVGSIRNAVATELARAKIAAAEVANRIHANARTLKESGLVVHDAAALVLKAPDDLAAVIAQRKAAEQARQEAERERIRQEEAARLEREAAAKAAAEKAEADRAERDELTPTARACLRVGALISGSTPPFAGYDQKFSPGSNPENPQADHEPADTGARLTLGQINERIAPLSISVAGLAELGFDPVEQVKASRLYRESDFPAICRAMVKHLNSVIVEGVTA